MKKSWFIGAFVVAAVVAVLVFLNFRGKESSRDLSEVFPEDEGVSSEVEYEFVDANGAAATTTESLMEEPETVDSTVETSEETPTEPPAPRAAPALSENKQTPATGASSVPVSPPTGSQQFTIQVSSFKDQKKADLFLAELRKKESTAYLLTKSLGEKGTFYRVCVGQFEQKSQAQAYFQKIKENYKDSFVISLKK